MFKKPVWLSIVSRKFLHNVGADVAIFLFNGLSNLHRTIWLVTFSEQALHKVGDISSSDGDTLDRGTDNITLCDWDNVGDTITGVNNGSC
jgi:hypothetical protein